jgi:hypothetical protein
LYSSIACSGVIIFDIFDMSPNPGIFDMSPKPGMLGMPADRVERDSLDNGVIVDALWVSIRGDERLRAARLRAVPVSVFAAAAFLAMLGSSEGVGAAVGRPIGMKPPAVPFVKPRLLPLDVFVRTKNECA